MSDTPYHEVWPLLVPALKETGQMVGVVSALTFTLGLPLGVLLFNLGPQGLIRNAPAYQIIGWFVNLLRSLPFLILMAAIIPFTKAVVGTTIGVSAAIVPLAVASVPFYARLVENAIREVPREVIDVSLASGGSRRQTATRVQVSEALPGIVSAMTVAVVGILSFTALAGALGAGGLGNLAITYGYQLFDNHIMIATVVTLLVLVQVIQLVGDGISRLVSRG